MKGGLFFIALTFQCALCLIPLPPIHQLTSETGQPRYSSSDIHRAKKASTNPFDYENMGLPTDILGVADNDVLCMLNELFRQRSTLFMKTVKEQSLYADAITRAKAADVDFGKEMQESFVLFEKENVFNRMKECSIGNLAYMSLYAASPKVRFWAKELLAEYVSWRYRKEGIDPNFLENITFWTLFDVMITPQRITFYNDAPDLFTLFRCTLKKKVNQIKNLLFSR